MLGNKEKKMRQREKDLYAKTQKKQVRRDMQRDIRKKEWRQGEWPSWTYKVGAVAGSLGLTVGTIVGLQLILMTMQNMGKDEFNKVGFFHNFGLGGVYAIIMLIIEPALLGFFWYKFHAVWYNNNAPYSDDDLEEFDRKDGDGNVITEHVEMFDKEFGRELYKFSNVASADQRWYNAKEYAFNEKNSVKEIAKGGNKRKGAFGRKEYDTLADYINGEFYPLDTDTQRPAGVYFYDSRPVNTILIAITRGGKGNMFYIPSVCFAA